MFFTSARNAKVSSISTTDCTAEVFSWDAPRRRLHPRNIYPIKIEINGQTYQTIEWSLGDFRVADFSMDMNRGAELIVKPIIQFRDFIIQFETIAIVLNYNAENKQLFAYYANLRNEHKELLKYFSNSLLTGDMVNIDNVLRRVDMPVTPATTELDRSTEPVKKTRFRRYLFSGLYLLLGGALLTLTLLTLYSTFFRLEVDSAVVSSPVSSVQASVKGYIKKIHVKVDDHVQQGDYLYHLTNTRLDGRLLKAQKDYAEKQQQVAMLKSLIVGKEKKLKSYKRISSEKHKAAQAKVNAERTHLTITKNSLKRVKGLRASGMISQTVLEEAEDKHAIAINNLKLAESKLGVTQESINALKNDYFYTGKELTGNIPEIKARLVRTLGEEEISKKALALAEKKLDELAITAPVSGKILNILATAGQYAQDAQPLLTILETSDRHYIEAYLTQKEVKWIELGTQATAYIPAISRELMVQVTRIDRTKGFYQEVDNRFNWRAPEDRSALVTLKFASGIAMKDLVIGLPVVLNFNKNDALRQKIVSIARFIGFKDTQDQDRPPDGKKMLAAASSTAMVAGSEAAECSFALWKIKKDYKSTASWQDDVMQAANKVLKQPPRPLKHIISSGVDDPKNPELIKSRRALRDADNAALLAIAYQITGDKKYFQHIKAILLGWAKQYIPNGHPINETRLEGMLWAYDRVRCELSANENQHIHHWLVAIQQAKHNWKFGKSSTRNNLRTHQLKMLIMLDLLLADNKALIADRKLLAKHQKVNLLKGGESIDYQERDALHYHTYNLEAWLEIALLDDNYKEVVNESYAWLIKQLNEGNTHGEFINSKQKIDARRASKGVAYAKKGGDFNTRKTARSIINHSTLNALPLLKQPEYKFLPETLSKPLLFHYARHFLWKN
jgi:multidrug resistance efflux pump